MGWRVSSDVMEILTTERRQNPELQRMVAEEQINGDVAQAVSDTRLAPGLTHAQFAKAIGMKADEIRDVENNDFEGDMLAVLREVALVQGLDRKLELRQKVQPKKTVRRKSA